MGRMVLKLIMGIVFSYILICLLVWLCQRLLIYPADDTVNPSPSAVGVPAFQPITVTAQDGLPLQAWWAPPKPHKPVIVYFHGNAGNVAERGTTMNPYFQQGYGAFLLEYRGYAGNPGKPSEQAFYQDANTAMQFVKDQGVPDKCVVIYGESLGTGVATQMAVTHQAGALVLQAPFTSLKDAARTHYFFLPTDLLLHESYDSLAKITHINMPLLILHGTSDKTVPIKLGKKLFAAAKQPKVWQEYAGAEHNNLITEFRGDRDVIKFIRRYVHCDKTSKN